MNPLAKEDRDRLLTGFEEAFETARIGLDFIKGWVEKNLEEVKRFATYPSNYAGLVDEKGCPNMYEGKFRVVGPDRSVLAEFDPSDSTQSPTGLFGCTKSMEAEPHTRCRSPAQGCAVSPHWA